MKHPERAIALAVIAWSAWTVWTVAAWQQYRQEVQRHGTAEVIFDAGQSYKHDGNKQRKP